MKNKIVILSTALFALLWLATGCNSGASSSGSGEKIKLELKLEKGQTFNRVQKMEQEVSMTMMGMANDVQQDMDFYFKQEVMSVNEAGVAEIKVTYERVVYNIYMSMLGTSMEYDSDKDKEASGNPMAEALKPLIGSTITMMLDKNGQVVDVRGMEELLASMGGETGSGDISTAFSPENIKKTMQGMTAIFPEVLVGEGDTWGSETDLSGDYPLALATTYKVEKIESGKIILDVDGSIKSKEGGTIPGGMGSFEMDGNQGGTMELDRATGMVERADLTQDVSGEINAMGMKSPISIESKITIEPY